jgi:hypothetical protein
VGAAVADRPLVDRLRLGPERRLRDQVVADVGLVVECGCVAGLVVVVGFVSAAVKRASSTACSSSSSLISNTLRDIAVSVGGGLLPCPPAMSREPRSTPAPLVVVVAVSLPRGLEPWKTVVNGERV